MHSNNTNELLHLKGVTIKKLDHYSPTIKVLLETKPKIHTCPACGQETKRIHDYRVQVVKHFPLMYKPVELHLKKRRYVCACGKRFYENYDFLARYKRLSNHLVKYILNECRDQVAFSTISRKLGVSLPTVIRTFDQINYPKPSQLPEVLCIDEFRGNSGGNKFQCILVDGKHHKILDILPGRTHLHLVNYFSTYSKHERRRVKFFVCDMWTPYVQLAQQYFPNAKIITDKYHFMRQVTWAMDKVRVQAQKTMPADRRKYYKSSKSLLLKHMYRVPESKHLELNIMLGYHDDLRVTHYLKEQFYQICVNPKYGEKREQFLFWIGQARKSKIKALVDVSNTFYTWREYILNALKYRYTNGVTEGFNNKIKVIKRIGYGYRNFRRFRNLILHTI